MTHHTSTEKHKQVFDALQALKIPFEVHYHPPTPTIEDVLRFWDLSQTMHCKNLFFRNHKGNRHYLVIFHCLMNLNIRDLELRLRQGKLTFASPERMQKYLGLSPGSVSPFGLLNDATRHVYVFIDKNLLQYERLSFHPNDNTASLSIATTDFVRFLEHCGNGFEFLELYEGPPPAA
ncbi:MAG: prolyl-tRNA synthetase associated domain-containing protein [Bacteroidetes bacterium]|nr:prolyl-tRNA synthetase associated domain-containing protein [Bacteroidota bacterium]